MNKNSKIKLGAIYYTGHSERRPKIGKTKANPAYQHVVRKTSDYDHSTVYKNRVMQTPANMDDDGLTPYRGKKRYYSVLTCDHLGKMIKR